MVLALLSVVNAAEWEQQDRHLEQDEHGGHDVECRSYGFEGFVLEAGDTEGAFFIAKAGERFIFTATGNGDGSWRIVGDPFGDLTYVDGGTFPGTLEYIVPEGGYAGPGIGFYVDAYTGTGDTISGTCVADLHPVPLLPSWALWMLAGIAGLGLMRLRKAV